jgi:hypothetical protein
MGQASVFGSELLKTKLPPAPVVGAGKGVVRLLPEDVFAKNK